MKFIRYIATVLPLLGLAFPARADTGGPRTFAELVCVLIDILNVVIPLLSTVALVVFLWGLAQYVFKADQESARERGKFVMTWGLLALLVLFSIWGILQFLYGEFGFQEGFGTFLLPTGDFGASTSASCSF